MTQKGNVIMELVFFLCLIWGVVWLSEHSKAERTKDLEVYLNTPRAETIKENAEADAAERQPQIQVPTGRFTYSFQGEATGKASLDLLLKDDGTFIMETVIKDDSKTLVNKSASGTYKAHGSTLVFKVQDGAKGFFPASGRVTVRNATNDTLVFSGENKDLVFQSAESREKAAQIAAAEKGAFLAKPFRLVRSEDKPQWLFDKYGMKLLVFGFITMAISGISMFYKRMKPGY